MPKVKKTNLHIKRKVQALEQEVKQLRLVVKELKQWKDTEGVWMSEAGRWRKRITSWQYRAAWCSRGFLKDEEEMKNLFVELLQTESRIPLCRDIIGIVMKYINWSTNFQK